MKEDVKEKSFSPPLGKMRVWWLTSSPTTLLEGLLVWPLWLAAHSSGEARPSCLSQLDGFMKQRCSTPFGYEATQAKRWLKVPTKILCETRGLQLFWVIRGGIGLTRRLGAKLQHTERLMSDSILSLEPEHRTNRLGHHRGRKTWEITWVLFDAQAACAFSCSASKRPPFFQSVKVMAAILRASVRRAISGFIPLASKAA